MTTKFRNRRATISNLKPLGTQANGVRYVAGSYAINAAGKETTYQNFIAHGRVAVEISERGVGATYLVSGDETPKTFFSAKAGENATKVDANVSFVLHLAPRRTASA